MCFIQISDHLTCRVSTLFSCLATRLLQKDSEISQISQLNSKIGLSGDRVEGMFTTIFINFGNFSTKSDMVSYFFSCLRWQGSKTMRIFISECAKITATENVTIYDKGGSEALFWRDAYESSSTTGTSISRKAWEVLDAEILILVLC